MTKRVLILGGTKEARVIAEYLAHEDGFTPVLSLAGATARPRTTSSPVETRVGGFGGAEALAHYIMENAIDMVIDATHPFAAQISANAVGACGEAGVPRFAFLRPKWEVSPPEVSEYPDWESLISALPRDDGTHLFLAAGHEGLAAFAQTGFTITARVMELPPIGSLPKGVQLVKSAPNTSWQTEAEIFTARKITHLVAKNSGSPEARAKITAAKNLGIPALLLARPAPPPPPVFTSLESLLAAVAKTGVV